MKSVSPLRRRRALVAGALTLLAVGLVVSLASAEPAATPDEMTWEQFRDAMQLTDADSLEATPLGSRGAFPVDMLWTVVAAVLVFWMQAGFALVEAGFTRAKNAVNIMMKNLSDFSFGSLAFWLVGFGLMFGQTNGVFGTTHFAPSPKDDTQIYAFLLFQTVFAATAATIASGAMAERTKFGAYIIYSIVISAFVYPVFGSWAWGGLYEGGGWLEAPEGGFLQGLGLPAFVDFAGSTVVHSVGAWAGLAGTLVLGPRIGKYTEQGARPILGHSMVFATVGMFILWMGWFGFNAGSTTAVAGGGTEPFGGAGKAFALIAINTNLAASAGVSSAIFVTWLAYGKPDIGIVVNGALAGLVAITAPCASVGPSAAIIIGAVAGGLVVASVELFERLRVDDPVGAVSVHGVCGAWGTLSAGIFAIDGLSVKQIATQLIGIGAAFAWSFGTTFILFQVIRLTMGLRVSHEAELEGLDLAEHAAEAYPQDITGRQMSAAE